MTSCPLSYFVKTITRSPAAAKNPYSSFAISGTSRLSLDTLRRTNPDHWYRAAAIRALTLDAISAASSGHSGMPMGMADVATVLFEKYLKFYASEPLWPDRDRFILSAGHGSMLLYALLYLTGSPHITLQEIKNFRQLGARTAGHPECTLSPGIETTTGPLGQGLANAIGFAIAEEKLRSDWGNELVDHWTYVIAGDGCLMEGISQEAISLAGHQKLAKLIVFWDDNKITIDGAVSLSDKTDQLDRFRASRWHVQNIDGHNLEEISKAIATARNATQPSLIACRTHIALGHAAQDTAKGHGALTDQQEIEEAKVAYGWTAAPFEIPYEIKEQWEKIGRRSAKEYKAWCARLAAQTPEQRGEFKRLLSGALPSKFTATLQKLKSEILSKPIAAATRSSSERILSAINPIMPETFGGSADLTASNNTKTSDISVFSPANRSGRYLYYGIREHAMAAAMNGMRLHGGIKPYGGTFLCFSDYARPAIRLAALMQTPTIFVMTHDSIGLGEDGPTHQPVEHLAMLRATPNLMVLRPADAVETLEAWEIALSSSSRPSILALTRQPTPTVRTGSDTSNLSHKGAYVLRDSAPELKAILLATGSEVSIALSAQEILFDQGIATRVVSMPCWELFCEQDAAYRNEVLPSGPVRVGIEAGVRFGWDQWLKDPMNFNGRSGFIGMASFGASAPANTLFNEFGITADNIVDEVKKLIP